MARARVLVCGIGDLGSQLIEMLARSPVVAELVCVDRNVDRVAPRVRGLEAGLVLQDREVRVSFEPLDLLNVDETARLIERFKPDVIVQTGTLLPVVQWWDIASRTDVGDRVKSAGFGPWLPLQLLLPLRLMQAVQKASPNTLVLNASYPDVANAVLQRIGVGPTGGTGNVALLESGLRLTAAQQLQVPVGDVGVIMAAHYIHLRWAMGGAAGLPPPFYLRVAVGDNDVTDRFDPLQLLRSAGKYVLWGEASHPLTASCIVRDVELLLGEGMRDCHMPGPGGQIGGYPVTVGQRRLEVRLPEGMTMAELQEMQLEAARWDGIEDVLADGTVRFTADARRTMSDVFEYDCAELTPDSINSCARELVNALKKRVGTA